MTTERSTAYGRVMKTLTDMGPSKLHSAETSLIRDAADTLLFAASQDGAAMEALTVSDRLMRDLIQSGRWTAESAQRLADDIAACGPAMALV